MANLPRGFKVALLASDEGIRTAGAAVLTACSYEVFPVSSVDDCLHLFTFRRIDIVLSEASDLDVDASKTAHLMTVLKNVPLIIMSDADTPNALFHGLKIGAVDFMKRPLDEAKVRSMWQHTLHKRLATAMVASDEGMSSCQRRQVAAVDESGVEIPATSTMIKECAPPQHHVGGGGGSSRFAAMMSVQSSAPSEGSSTEGKMMTQSTLESGKRIGQHHLQTAQQRPVNSLNAQEASTTQQQQQQHMRRLERGNTRSLPSHLTSTATIRERSDVTMGLESQKRSHPVVMTDDSQRRIRPNLMNRDSLNETTSGHVGSGGSGTGGVLGGGGGGNVSTSMNVPPLLGIPPGCVPPVGSNGLAIGMPFLNHHPFVPASPMNMNTFSFPGAFTFGGAGTSSQEVANVNAPSTPSPTLTGSVGATTVPPMFESSSVGPFPFFPLRTTAPTMAGMIPTSVAGSIPRSRSLHRSGSTPATPTISSLYHEEEEMPAPQSAMQVVATDMMHGLSHIQGPVGEGGEGLEPLSVVESTTMQDPERNMRKSSSLVNF